MVALLDHFINCKQLAKRNFAIQFSDFVLFKAPHDFCCLICGFLQMLLCDTVQSKWTIGLVSTLIQSFVASEGSVSHSKSLILHLIIFCVCLHVACRAVPHVTPASSEDNHHNQLQIKKIKNYAYHLIQGFFFLQYCKSRHTRAGAYMCHHGNGILKCEPKPINIYALQLEEISTHTQGFRAYIHSIIKMHLFCP